MSLAFAPRAAPRVISSTPAATSSSTECACEASRTYNLTCEQGQTLSTMITVTVDSVPVDFTGGEFQFTAKTDPSLPDTDPSTVKKDWQETSTPVQGKTWLTLDAAITQTMQPVGYQYQIRFVSANGIVTPLVKGTLTIVVPVSSRYA